MERYEGSHSVVRMVRLFHFVITHRVKTAAQIAEAKNSLPAINGLAITPILPAGTT
jgi:hypothetical protein